MSPQPIPVAEVPDGAVVVGIYEPDPDDEDPELDFDIAQRVGDEGRLLYHNALNEGPCWALWSALCLPERVYVVGTGYGKDADPYQLHALGEAFVVMRDPAAVVESEPAANGGS